MRLWISCVYACVHRAYGGAPVWRIDGCALQIKKPHASASERVAFLKRMGKHPCGAACALWEEY